MTASLITFPGVRIEDPAVTEIRLRFAGRERAQLQRVANAIGISLDDAAARMVRLGLKKFKPFEEEGE